MDILVRIKRLILTGRGLYTRKAEVEIATDTLTEELVCEAIINTPSISKIADQEYYYVLISSKKSIS